VFDIVDVSDWTVDEAETAGDEEKLWLRDGDGWLWLFKPRTEHPTWVQGEDWAEKIAAEVAAVLRVPAARVELASRNGVRGSVSRSVRPVGWELQPGALLLTRVVPGYLPKVKGRPGHTIANIRSCLRAVAPPPEMTGGDRMDAFDVFVGYLILDALIANQDRHEENWAVLRPLPGGGSIALCPSYDHGSSLGFNLQDERRAATLSSGRLEEWVGRGRAQRFDSTSDGQLTLVGLARSALMLGSEGAQQHWKDRLTVNYGAVWTDLAYSCPGLSEPARMFVSELLTANLGRLRDEL
jgi:hypothetical protein